MSPEDIVSEIEDLIADGYVSADQRRQVIGCADDLVIDLGRWRAFAVGVACLTGADSPDDVIIDDMPDLLGAVDRLRTRAEAAEAAMATARAEGAAAERAAVLGALRAQLAYAAPRGWPEAVEMLEECIEDIEAGAHVRPVEAP